MKCCHRQWLCSHTSPRRSPTMVTLHDTQFVECEWWNDGWTVKTVVTWWSKASMIPAPGDLWHTHHTLRWTTLLHIWVILLHCPLPPPPSLSLSLSLYHPHPNHSPTHPPPFSVIIFFFFFVFFNFIFSILLLFVFFAHLETDSLTERQREAHRYIQTDRQTGRYTEYSLNAFKSSTETSVKRNIP